MGAGIAVQIQTEGPRGVISRFIIVLVAPQAVENAGEQVTEHKEQQHEN